MGLLKCATQYKQVIRGTVNNWNSETSCIYGLDWYSGMTVPFRSWPYRPHLYRLTDRPIRLSDRFWPTDRLAHALTDRLTRIDRPTDDRPIKRLFKKPSQKTDRAVRQDRPTEWPKYRYRPSKIPIKWTDRPTVIWPIKWPTVLNNRTVLPFLPTDWPTDWPTDRSTDRPSRPTDCSDAAGPTDRPTERPDRPIDRQSGWPRDRPTVTTGRQCRSKHESVPQLE